MDALLPFRVTPQYRARVWGGNRLAPPGPEGPIGEAWLVYGESTIAEGPYAGETLAALAALQPEALLGAGTVARTGARFPLLIKLLDCADWLSVQVHPDDAQAERLAGPGAVGKTEAWHVLAAEPGARLVHGLRPGLTTAALGAAIRDGTLTDHLRYTPIASGESMLVSARTIHAIGPGLLIYEIQEDADITYRVFDWNRPAAAGRALHLEETLAVADPAAVADVIPAAAVSAGVEQPLLSCPHFALSLIGGPAGATTPLTTAGDHLHTLTVIAGTVQLTGAGWTATLGQYESLVLPACTGAYTAHFPTAARALVARTG